jgi:hypothetical protein
MVCTSEGVLGCLLFRVPTIRVCARQASVWVGVCSVHTCCLLYPQKHPLHGGAISFRYLSSGSKDPFAKPLSRSFGSRNRAVLTFLVADFLSTMMCSITSLPSATDPNLNEPLLLRDDDTSEQENDECCEDCDSYCYDLQDIVKKSWCDVIMVWMILPVLLVVQFTTSFMVPTPGAMICSMVMDCHMVMYALGLFLITLFMFEQATRDSAVAVMLTRSNCDETPWDTVFTALTLFPEIIMDVALIMLFFDKVLASFLFLQVCVLVMSSFVVVSSLYILIVCRNLTVEEASDNEDKTYTLLADEDENSNSDKLCAVQTV